MLPVEIFRIIYSYIQDPDDVWLEFGLTSKELVYKSIIINDESDFQSLNQNRDINEIIMLYDSFIPMDYSTITKLTIINDRIKSIPNFERLKILELDCKLISVLPELKKLKKLRIIRSGIRSIPEHLSSLEELIVENRNGGKVKMIKNIPSLKKLEIRDKGTVFIGGLENLEQLKIIGCSDSLRFSRQLNSLKNLDISFSTIKTIDLILRSLEKFTIKDCKNIKKINTHSSIINEVYLDGINIKKLDGVPRSEKLTIRNCPYINKFPYLFLWYTKEMTLYGTSIRELPRKIPDIEFLDITDVVIYNKKIETKKGVKTIKNNGMKTIPELKKLKKLIAIESGLEELPRGLVNLEELDVSYNYYLEGLPNDLNKLKKLNITDCYRINFIPRSLYSLQEIVAFQRLGITAIPEIKTLKIIKCNKDLILSGHQKEILKIE